MEALNNNHEYSAYDGTLTHPAGVIKTAPPGFNEGSAMFAGGGTAKTKSKKSLNSIVARLSNQSQTKTLEGHQFMAALSLTERLPSPPQLPMGYEATHMEAPSYEEGALDLSLKSPNVYSNPYESESPHVRTDSIGALDLSMAGSTRPHVQTSEEPPDFVLNLTQASAYPSPSGSSSPHLVQSVRQATPSPTYPQTTKTTTQNSARDSFQANHRRLLHFLTSHTIAQRIAGPEVDIELLTCRYCKYASTEKSCMMTHLSTAHMSKKRGGNKARMARRQEGGERPEGGRQHSPSGLVIPQYKRSHQHQQVSPPSYAAHSKALDRSHFQQLSQVAEDGSLKFLPTPVVNLSPMVKQGRSPSGAQPSTIQSASPRASPHSLKTSSSSSLLESRLVEEGECTLPANQVAYLGEDGRIYLLPHSSSGKSAMEERNAKNRPGGSSSNTLLGSSGSTTSAGNKQPFSEDMQRQLKLNHLCNKLAKRMDRQKNRDHGFNDPGQPNPAQQLPQPKRRRKSSGVGKRQHLITQTGTFSCEYCPKTFKRPLSLYGHLKQHSPLLKKHRKEGLIQCSACPLAFTNVQELLQHVRGCHSKLDSRLHYSVQVRREVKAASAQSTGQSPGGSSHLAGQSPQQTALAGEGIKSHSTGVQESGQSSDATPRPPEDHLLDNDATMKSSLPTVNPVLEKKPELPDLENRLKDDMAQPSTSGNDNPKHAEIREANEKMAGGLLNLRHSRRRKNIRHAKYKVHGLGWTWKAKMRTCKSKRQAYHFRKVLRFFTRSSGGLGCKDCKTTFRPTWKAVTHFKTSHLSPKDKPDKTNLAVVSGEAETVAPSLPATSTKLGANLFVRMDEEEKYQCNLCLQVFEGQKFLAAHRDMHKEIYEAGIQSVAGIPPAGIDKVQVQSAKSESNETNLSSEVSNGPKADGKAVSREERPDKLGVVHHYGSQLADGTVEKVNQSSRKTDQGNGASERMTPSKQPKTVGRMKAAHSGRLLCKLCKLVTYSTDEMRKHLRKHTKTLLTCDQCSYQTIEKRLIIRHIQTVHEQKRPYTCELCVYSTAYKHHLKRHYRSHSIDLLTCLKCSFCTLQEAKLLEHMKEHDLSPNIVMCDDCGLTFASPKILKEHSMETHNKTGADEQQAPLDNGKERSGFAANWWENLPMTAIDEESIVEQHCCPACKLITKSSDEVMLHMMSEHLEEEQKAAIELSKVSEAAPAPKEETSDIYIPVRKREPTSSVVRASPPLPKRKREDVLYQNSRASSSLKKELPPDIYRISATPVEIPRPKKEAKDIPHLQRLTQFSMDLCQCPQCGFITSTDQMEAHLETHNSEETYACEHCQFETRELESLLDHKAKHVKHKISLTCAQCGEVQTDVLSLRNHTRIHLITIGVDNPFRCSLCPYSTESMEDGEYHLDQHNYVMEFKCQVCMYSSPTLSGLTSHRKLHRKVHTSTHVQKVKSTEGQ